MLLAHELGHDRALNGEVRGDEHARRGDEREQHGERQQPGAVEDRDRCEERCAGDVADEHRPARPDARRDRAAPEAEHADRHDLRDDHPRHLLR